MFTLPLLGWACLCWFRLLGFGSPGLAPARPAPHSAPAPSLKLPLAGNGAGVAASLGDLALLGASPTPQALCRAGGSAAAGPRVPGEGLGALLGRGLPPLPGCHLGTRRLSTLWETWGQLLALSTVVSPQQQWVPLLGLARSGGLTGEASGVIRLVDARGLGAGPAQAFPTAPTPGLTSAAPVSWDACRLEGSGPNVGLPLPRWLAS